MNLYVIHSKRLSNRLNYLQSTISKLQELSSNKFDIKIISSPDTIDISTLKSRIRLERTNDPDFDKYLNNINEFQALNIEAHREAYTELIKSNSEWAWILEDDTVISTEYIENIKQLIGSSDKFTDWDIIFTGFTSLNEPQKEFKFIDLKLFPSYKILPSKASYIIKKSFAIKLLEYTSTYKYNMRIMLSRYIEIMNDCKAGVINKYLLVEATKLGLLPSSINPNNALVFNPDYIDMMRIVGSETVDLKVAKEKFNKLENLKSADVYHLMGIIYHKKNMHLESRECFEEAISILKNKNGYIGRGSDILNNCINSFQYEQLDFIS